MYVSFVKNAMAQKSRGDLAPYNELLAQFQVAPSAGGARVASPAQLQSWLSALSHVSPLLDRSCTALVDAATEFPWLGMPDDIADAWVRFVCALVSARSEWISKVATLLFENFALHPPWYRDPAELGLGQADQRPTRRQLYDRLHGLLRQLLRLIPTLPSALQSRIVQHFPHKRDRTLSQVLYIRNLLRVTEYCEALTEPIWTAIVDHALLVDVEIQVELDELEEQGVEPAALATLAHVLDRGMHEADSGSSATSSPALDAKHTDDDELDTLEDLDDEDGYDDDALLPSKAAEREPAWNEVAVLAGKLDGIMKALFEFLAQYVGHGSTRGGASASIETRRYQLYQTLLSIFTRSVLTTFKSRHVQFLLFWYSSLDAEFTDMFLGTLLSKSLYAPGAHADAATVPTGESAAIIRIAAASYVASYVARARYIDAATTRMVLLNLCTYLDACLESFSQLGAMAPPPGARDHAMFYAVAQAVFYLYCFRWRDLRQGQQDAEPSAHHGDDDPAASLASTYPSACSLELSPQLLPTLHGTSHSYSSASSSTSARSTLGSEAGWAPGLAVVQRAITSPLNPLRYCNANVVQQFAYVAQHTGFLYCYSILDTNQRRSAADRETSGTPKKKNAPRQGTRESTPLAHPTNAPAAIPAKALEAFFPFDPYRLRDSGEVIQPLYREWSDVAPEGGEEDDEDVDNLDESSSSDDLASMAGARRTQLSAMLPRRHPQNLFSSSDHLRTPDSVAQSLEAMSISPYTG